MVKNIHILSFFILFSSNFRLFFIRFIFFNYKKENKLKELMNNNYYIKKMKYIPINKISLYQKCILNSIKNKNTFMLKFLVKTKLMIKRVSVKLM